MIVTTDIGNILYRDCKAFGIDIVPDGETLMGELKSEGLSSTRRNNSRESIGRNLSQK